MQYTKGAPDEVLKLCTHYLHDGRVEPINDSIKEEIRRQTSKCLKRLFEFLMGACRVHKDRPEDYSIENLEQGLCFIGLTGMIDPVRPEVKAAIEKCEVAGIRPIMITGDHVDTASAIASELGILKEGMTAVTGSQVGRHGR